MENTDKFYELNFNLWLKINYHESQESWCHFTSKTIKIMSLISGTAAGTALLSNLPQNERVLISTILSFVVATLSLIDLVFDLSGGGRIHAGLKSKYSQLRANLALELASLKPNSDERLINKIRKKFDSEMQILYGEGPPTYFVVEAIAWNDTARRMGIISSEDEIIPISFLQRIFGHILRFDNLDVRTTAERKNPPSRNDIRG